MARQGAGPEDEQLDSELGAVTAAYLSSVGTDRTAESKEALISCSPPSAADLGT
jgi:hypothetical protein